MKISSQWQHFHFITEPRNDEIHLKHHTFLSTTSSPVISEIWWYGINKSFLFSFSLEANDTGYSKKATQGNRFVTSGFVNPKLKTYNIYQAKEVQIQS